MPWGAIAGLVGAAAGLYGSKKNADAAKDIADNQNPYDIARANAQVNNVNRYTPFGSVEYSRNAGNPNDPSDDTYSMRQTYSPQMQQLMDSMLGVAGAAPAKFQSNVPSGLNSIMSEVYGGDVPGSQYTPSYDGFGQNRRPGAGQVMEGFNWQNYDEQGNQIANDTYQAFDGAPDDFRASGDVGLRVTPGETTNRQILDQLFNLGHISDYDYNTMLESFQTSGSGSKNAWSYGFPASEYESWLPENLHPRFRQTNLNIFNALEQYNPNKTERNQQDQPDASAYDQQAMDALIQAMTAQGGV